MKEEEDTEKRDDKLPPCVRRCKPGFEKEIETLMELPCRFLKAIGICQSDGDLCVKDWLIKPSNYRRTKLMSFRDIVREAIANEIRAFAQLK